MKKIMILIITLSFFMIGCNNNQDKIVDDEKINENEKVIENENLNKVDNQNDDINDLDESFFEEISATEFKQMVSDNQKYVFFIGRDTCPACQNFKPIAKEFSSKEQINIYYVNSTYFSDSDWNIISSIVKVDYIPTIVISENSNILYNEHGVKSYEQLKNIMEEYLK